MELNQHRGKFIVIEGIDGAGKSTQGEMIAKFYADIQGGIFLTAEPTKDIIGSLIRKSLSNGGQISAECLQLLFAADRADHLHKEILPRLEAGINIICDRYFMSSLAYGSINIPLGWLAGINSIFLKPDLTIFLDVDVGLCSRRIMDDGRSLEIFERSDILEKVRTNYLKIIETYNKQIEISILDGNGGKEEVFSRIKFLLDKKLFI